MIDFYVFALFCNRLFQMTDIDGRYSKKVEVFRYPNTKFNRFAPTKAIIYEEIPFNGYVSRYYGAQLCRRRHVAAAIAWPTGV
jgi:hypothetical protein